MTSTRVAELLKAATEGEGDEPLCIQSGELAELCRAYLGDGVDRVEDIKLVCDIDQILHDANNLILALAEQNNLSLQDLSILAYFCGDELQSMLMQHRMCRGMQIEKADREAFVAANPPNYDELHMFYVLNEKIAAIKKYKNRTGCTLIQAKKTLEECPIPQEG